MSLIMRRNALAPRSTHAVMHIQTSTTKNIRNTAPVSVIKSSLNMSSITSLPNNTQKNMSSIMSLLNNTQKNMFNIMG